MNEHSDNLLTIGQQLRQAREAQKLSLGEIAGATHMRERYLRALEEDDYDTLPSPAQARGFLRSYANYLKINPEPLLQELIDGAAAYPVKPEQAERSTRPLTAKNGKSTATNGRNGSRTANPAEASGGPDYDQADEIFSEIGRRLQNQRELLGMSLDDVVRYTHLRRHYLQALESGRLDDLPSPVQGRGMLDNYAVFLGMEPEPLLLRFAEGLQARLTVRQVEARTDPTTQPVTKPRRRRTFLAPLRRLLSPDILIGVTFAIFLVVFVVWGGIRIFAMNNVQTPEPTTPSIAEVLLATATPNLAPTELSPITEGADNPTLAPEAVILPDESGADATAIVIMPTAGGPGVQVYITISQRAWLRALVDGKVEFEGRVIPGSAYPFVGGSQVEILTSNGAAVQVFYNGQDLGALGDFGEVVDRIYTPGGIITPTPGPTRTPAPTPRGTATVPAALQPEAGTPASP
ncbi:MAG: Xre family DNA-binding protein [Chloroflexi bacterium]|nr:Xre family DNA-binding protein [Chloroflexota bacterium]